MPYTTVHSTVDHEKPPWASFPTGQRLGSHPLIDALCRVSRAERDLGIHAIEVVAIDSPAKGFYLKYGFTELADDPHHLFISMKTIRKLGLV